MKPKKVRTGRQFPLRVRVPLRERLTKREAMVADLLAEVAEGVEC